MHNINESAYTWNKCNIFCELDLILFGFILSSRPVRCKEKPKS